MNSECSWSTSRWTKNFTCHLQLQAWEKVYFYSQTNQPRILTIIFLRNKSACALIPQAYRRKEASSDQTGKEHCLQAANLAQQAHADADTVVAALLHDIGQFVPGTETRAL